MFVFSNANIFGYSFVIYSYWKIYLDIHAFNIYDSEYIWIFIVSQNCLKIVIIGPKECNMGPKYENGQNSPKQSWANYLIFEYIQTFWTNIFNRKNICWFFLGRIIWMYICDHFIMPNIYGYSFVQYLFIRPKKKDICPTLKGSKIHVFIF